MTNGMKVIPQKNYGKIAKQLSEIPFNTLFARAVLDLKANGTVWGDNPDNPKTVYIAHFYGMSLLFGNTENEAFNISLAEYMLNINGNRLHQEWLQVYPDNWNNILQKITKGKIINYSAQTAESPLQEAKILIEKKRKNHLIQYHRVNFTYNPVNKILHSKPSGTIKLIDSDVWDKIAGSVIPQYFWQCKEDFLLNGIGYALMNGNDVVSIAFASFIFENQLEIGVETAEKHRGMGFAQQVCKKMLDYCQTYNYAPIWACRKENTGSYCLAKSLGFEEIRVIPYYQLVH